MAAPLSTAAVVNAIIFGAYGSFTRLWEKLIEDGRQHDEVHGTMSGEGGVFIDHTSDGHGIHEQMKDWKKQDAVVVVGDDVVRDSSLFRVDSEGGTSSSSGQQTTKQLGLPTEKSSAVGSEDRPEQQTANTLKVFVCGSAAGMMQSFVICPMEHIKCRLQVQQSVAVAATAATAKTTATIASTQQRQLYKGPFDAGISITKNHGFFNGFYRGMGVTLLRETPSFGLYFAVYDTIKNRVVSFLHKEDERHPIPSHAHAWAASALAGGLSGALTWMIIYPLDVIKSRIQTGPLERELRRGMWTVGRDIVEEKGWRGLFRGLGITLVRAFPVNAIIFPVYEFVLIELGNGD